MCSFQHKTKFTANNLPPKLFLLFASVSTNPRIRQEFYQQFWSLKSCWKLLSEGRKDYFRDPIFQKSPGGACPCTPLNLRKACKRQPGIANSCSKYYLHFPLLEISKIMVALYLHPAANKNGSYERPFVL